VIGLPRMTLRRRAARWWYAVRYFPDWRVMYDWNRNWERHGRAVAMLRTLCNRAGLWR
jgi:hypothetical protein